MAHVGSATDVCAPHEPARVAHVGCVTDVTVTSASQEPARVAHVGRFLDVTVARALQIRLASRTSIATVAHLRVSRAGARRSRRVVRRNPSIFAAIDRRPDDKVAHTRHHIRFHACAVDLALATAEDLPCNCV